MRFTNPLMEKSENKKVDIFNARRFFIKLFYINKNKLIIFSKVQ